MDLKKLNEKKLAELQAEITAELARKKQEKKRDVVNEVKALLAKHGMTLDDLPARGGAKRSAPKAKVAPKYRNKANPAETWTGRGRKPRWVEDHLAKGGKLADLAI